MQDAMLRGGSQLRGLVMMSDLVLNCYNKLTFFLRLRSISDEVASCTACAAVYQVMHALRGYLQLDTLRHAACVVPGSLNSCAAGKEVGQKAENRKALPPTSAGCGWRHRAGVAPSPLHIKTYSTGRIPDGAYRRGLAGWGLSGRKGPPAVSKSASGR
jgi:hypothetical protein